MSEASEILKAVSDLRADFGERLARIETKLEGQGGKLDVQGEKLDGHTLQDARSFEELRRAVQKIETDHEVSRRAGGREGGREGARTARRWSTAVGGGLIAAYEMLRFLWEKP